MRGEEKLGEELIKKIKTSIRVARSARHVPARIIQVGDIPVTLTGKKVEGELLACMIDSMTDVISSDKKGYQWSTCTEYQSRDITKSRLFGRVCAAGRGDEESRGHVGECSQGRCLTV